MKPQLVKDKETGQLCLQLSMGAQTATIPLPPDFKDWEPARKEHFFEQFVIQASKTLKKRQPYNRRIK